MNEINFENLNLNPSSNLMNSGCCLQLVRIFESFEFLLMIENHSI
jgi:hypothetical protein